MTRVEVSRDDHKAYLEAAAGCFEAKDAELFGAFDAAECALDDGEDNAVELFAAFCALLDARGIVVTTLVDDADSRAFRDHCEKNPGSNRGRTY
jgi:hypothetical protein